MILALRVLGRSRAKSTRSGLSALPIWRATRSVSSARSESDGDWPGRRTTKQTIASPFTAWGTPMTPASATAAWPTSTDSTSAGHAAVAERSEEHTSELQSPCNLVCRLLLEKKKHH